MLNLQEMVKQGQQTITITLTERLPSFINSSCQLNVTYRVESVNDFYLIHLHVQGLLPIYCQRCLDQFNFAYDNTTKVAVCRTEDRAEQILPEYECFVAANFQVSLEELLIDELHLYAPQFHPAISDCNAEINQILTR